MVSRARVHGGIITDQMLTGSLTYFKIGGVSFGYVLSDGTVKMPGTGVSGGDAPVTYYTVVPEGVSVAQSSAEQALQVILEKCTIVQIGVVGTPEATGIHIACENTSMGWGDGSDGSAAAAMQVAIRDLGTLEDVPAATSDSDPDGAAPVVVTIDMSAATVEEVSFELA